MEEGLGGTGHKTQKYTGNFLTRPGSGVVLGWIWACCVFGLLWCDGSAYIGKRNILQVWNYVLQRNGLKDKLIKTGKGDVVRFLPKAYTLYITRICLILKQLNTLLYNGRPQGQGGTLSISIFEAGQ